MAVQEKWIRIIQLAINIRGRPGIKARELASLLNVCERTIYRYINEMFRIGWDVQSDQRGYRMGNETFLPALNLTLEEALALVLAARQPEVPELFVESQLDGALAKITSALPVSVRASLQQVQSLVSVPSGPRSALTLKQKEVARILRDGANQKISVDAVYQAFGEKKPVRRRLDPYHLFFRGRAWYLIAKSHSEDGIRLFRLNRFHSAYLTPFPFQWERNFNLERFLQNAFTVAGGEKVTEVKVRFASEIAPYIEEVQWHTSQKLERQSNGDLIFTVSVAAPEEVLRWTLSWEDKAEILAPKALRERARKVVQALEKTYKD